ncbi:ABC transporter ATP-binding protein [Plantactinospora sp. KBS50]|uniref:ABC transporter ATP-binding protein n=1 Tax=Plantactinospora sp. KBS50 TaxID=2024580 RepID=UPI000BAB0159|nr:ATP-binding cassette domain-containing protein [Plantactinospora sp. KBS50]ASW55647.1 hypothetical protein CIK06_17855 [Plantactinospora sp. KBS50]
MDGDSTTRTASNADWLGAIFDRPPLSADHPALSFRDVRARFGGVQALAGVTFDVRRHDVVAVIGPNGAGKSTLLNAVSGLLHEHVSGQILFDGEPMLGEPATRIAARGVGRSFQDPPLVDSESVLENVLLGAHLRLAYRMGDQIWRRGLVRRREAEARERAVSILEFTGLAHLRHDRVGGLPYGTRKLIDIARALFSGPRVLLLDEPTSGLDPEEQRAVGKLLTELHRATPVTLLLVEHHLDVVRAVANRVVGLQSGAVLVAGSPDEVLDSAAFRDAVIGGQRDGGGGAPPTDPPAEPERPGPRRSSSIRGSR